MSRDSALRAKLESSINDAILADSRFGRLTQVSLDQTPVQITGNDWEEIGTCECRLSSLLYGDRLNKNGSQF